MVREPQAFHFQLKGPLFTRLFTVVAFQFTEQGPAVFQQHNQVAYTPKQTAFLHFTGSVVGQLVGYIKNDLVFVGTAEPVNTGLLKVGLRVALVLVLVRSVWV